MYDGIKIEEATDIYGLSYLSVCLILILFTW